MKIDIPAVSIIIPMYNAEKYIGECLDSILAQTFDDYEVIVVDDASTDNSRDVVESYLPKFNGKLKLICSEKNSGRAGVPRNKALKFARGEYIMCVDSDDAITETAIEELYPIAKKFDADVLYCEKHYEIPEGENLTTDKNFLKETVFLDLEYNFVSEPTPVANNLDARIDDFVSFKFYVTTWSYFVRREFIYRNNLYYPATKYNEDVFWSMAVVCLAKNLVRVPNKIYIYHILKDSLSHSLNSWEKFLRWYTDHIFQGVDIVRKFASEFEGLKNRPDIQYKLFDFLARRGAEEVATLYEQYPAWEIEKLITNEIDKVHDKTSLIAVLFARMNKFAFQLQEQDKYFADTLLVTNEVLEKQQAQIEYYKNQLDYYRQALEKSLK